MSDDLNPQKRRWTAVVLGLVLSICLTHADDPSQDSGVDTIRFDAVLELNAPLVGANTLLFARYWVGADHYSIGIAWAEPSPFGLNFPTKPMTLSIDSNPQSFSIASQRQPNLTVAFTKPVGQRGVFQHKFNSYPMPNLRFADSEGLASRICLQDLKDVPQDTNDNFWTVDLATLHGGQVRGRVAKAHVRRDDGYITDMNLADVNDRPMKKIHYEYRAEGDKKLLDKETVLLPETFLTVGFLGKGATITLNGHKRTFKELPSFHHEGGRDCTVDFDPFKMESRLLAVPSSVVVRKADDKAVLRMAHMSDFVHLRLTAKEAEQAAQRFAGLDAQDQAVYELFERYWLKDTNQITDEDAATLKNLRAHFEDAAPRGKIAGEQLKRLGLLIQLDWIQGDSSLQRHFREYLAALTANGFVETLIPAGCEMIDVTARWRRFAVADQMMESWLDTVMITRSPASIRHYAESQGLRTRWWIVARLIEKSLQSQDWGSAKLAGQVLRCKAIRTLNEALQMPDSAKTTPVKPQATWAASSYGRERLLQALQECLAEAKGTFSSLREPTKEQRMLKGQLDRLDTALTGAELSAGVSR